ncbi:penicillin-binding protein 1C [Sphingomonas sp.]|jgi:penicillin-binding protein 1C|uniref:penicillin-binding protein 1C n=1 Tax=Sphingomonas sp. TaxID=28214 RepID=UPI002E30056B|nr:penicillin-binding protein 1C [Sphingomonas sp.]HEX4695494.1 penicillin-binding protein 1C [Sphingomonas sp.]
MNGAAGIRTAWRWARRVEARVDDVIADAGVWLLRRRPRTRKQWTLTGLGTLFGAVLLLDILTLPPPIPDYAAVRAAWQPSEAWLYDRNGVLIDSSRVDYQRRRLAWTPLDRVARPVTEAVVAAEDHRFYAHGGVDWLASFAALRDRIERKPSRGASTLSMQVAGFLSPELARPGARGWLDKLRQMRAATALDGAWSKDQILEAYLNLAGFRGEAQGIGAAALGLFGKTPDALSRDDALLLTALLPNPQATPATVARRACGLAGERDCTRFEAAAYSMLGPARSLALDPGLAPHLAAKLLTKPGLKITTTLDADIQRIAIGALKRELEGLGSSRARDGAVVVLDNASGDVLAYVGGIGGNSTAPDVDAADSPRQAGSTLKPFLYAQAIEKGYLTPASILDDSPVQLDTASGLYVPQNYDKGFKGQVSVRSALAGSLNVPAVRTLLLVGVDAFRDRLWDTGYTGLVEDGDYYGYSLALGSAEVTLLQQADAYRSLANGGRWSPLRFVANDPATQPRAIVSAQAAWIVADMMADPNARAVTFGLDSSLRLPFWAAVKTGTSKAMRDNWCVGFSDRYTVAVWVGNMEGDPMRVVSGVSGAAPVWRDVMLALHADRPSRAPPMPAGVEPRAIAFAGNIEQPRREYFLKGTGMSLIAAAPPESRRPRITNPVSGSVYAIDPDIPMDRQRLALAVTGDAATHRLLLDQRDLGDASTAPLILPGPGRHRLALLDLSGKVVDQVVFTMR